MNLIDFYKQFPTEEACLEYLEAKRWPHVRTCPRCGGLKTYKFKTRQLFKCAACNKQFSAKVGTIFSESPIPLQKWFLVIYLATSLKKGISSVQTAKYINVTQTTAWFMLHRIRETMDQQSGFFDQLKGTVEVDETFIGGVRKGGKPGRGANKSIVLGLAERKGRVKTQVINSTKGTSILPVIRDGIAQGSKVMTDDFNTYNVLPRMGYRHNSINHSRKKYAHGEVYTNTVEGVWSHIKNGLRAIQINVSPKHLQRYCDEYAYKYNTRDMTDFERFEDWFSHTRGRLTYEELIS